MRKKLSDLKEEHVKKLNWRPGGLYIGTTLCEAYEADSGRTLMVRDVRLDSDPPHVEGYIPHTESGVWKYEFNEIEIDFLF